MRLTIGLAAVIAACGGLVACAGDSAPLSPQPNVRLSLHPGGSLAPVPYWICNGNLPYSGSAMIGPAGGKVAFGPHTLTVPAGALPMWTNISAQMSASDTIAVKLQPENLTFLVPATLQLSYAQCTPQPAVPVTIIAVNDQLNTLVANISSNMLSAQESVSASIAQLGVYAVAIK